MPGGIVEAPTLDEGHEFYLHAYLDLSTCRPVGFGPRPIPWTAIRDYAQAYGMQDLDEFRTIIGATDELIRQDIEAREAAKPESEVAKP